MLSKLGYRTIFTSETNLSAAHLLGPGLALPHTDSKAESFAESMSSRIYLSEEEILAVADMPPLTNETLSLLQEILCKLGKQLSPMVSY